MSANRTVRLRTFRIAILLASLLSLLSLVVPKEAVLPEIGRYLGAGKAAAADVTPVTVDNSTSGTAVMAPTQRKAFYAAGRFWVFYSDGADLVYKSSIDGLSWSAKSAPLGAMTTGDGAGVCFDGTYVHYARTTSTNGEPLYYRRGVPDADGTIAWSAVEQIAVAGTSGFKYQYPSVSVDSSGRALISYHYDKQNGLGGEGPYVTRSGNTDGTWGSTPAEFPHALAAESESEWYTTVHGLTEDKIAVTFADHTDAVGISVATYNGTLWNPVQTTASDPQFGSGYGVVAEGDDIHIVLLTTSTFDLIYCKYSYATNTLGSEYALLGSATASSYPALSMDSNDDLYCFWPGAPAAGHIYYARMVSDVWDAGYTDWVTETDLTANGGVSAFYGQGGSDYIGVAWETGSAAPYDVRFAALDMVVESNEPPNQPANTLPTDGSTGVSLTPTLQSSDFSDTDIEDTHCASQWQISPASDNYTKPVFDSQTDNVNLLSVLVPADTLSYSTTYYWHVRHQDDHGDWSEWSAETSFSTLPAPNQPPNQPGNLLPGNGTTGLSLTPTLQSSDFSDPDSGDRHGASQWQITAAAGDYSSPVFDSQTDNVNLVSFPIASGTLTYSSTYYWRVRHQDNRGDWSEWSVETSFITTSAPNQPPDQPGNVAPADGTTDVSLTPTMESAYFSDPDSGDTHGASQWQITAAAGDYSSPVFDSQTDNVNLVSFPIASGTLTYSSTYYWRVRHQDNRGDWSEWSMETCFFTAAEPVTPPEPDDTAPAEPVTPLENPDDEDNAQPEPATPEQPDGDDAAPASPSTPSDELDNGGASSASPDNDRDPGPLPFILAIAAGAAAVAVVGSGLFIAYGIHVRMVNRPRGLRSARTISKRLRK